MKALSGDAAAQRATGTEFKQCHHQLAFRVIMDRMASTNLSAARPQEFSCTGH
jgi:hypothetical protein